MARPGCLLELLAKFLADFAAEFLQILSPPKKSIRAYIRVHCLRQKIRVPEHPRRPCPETRHQLFCFFLAAGGGGGHGIIPRGPNTPYPYKEYTP